MFVVLGRETKRNDGGAWFGMPGTILKKHRRAPAVMNVLSGKIRVRQNTAPPVFASNNLIKLKEPGSDSLHL